MIREFFRHGAIYTIPSILSRGISLLLLPVYTRVLSPAEYGIFDLLIVFATLVNLTIALEVSQGLARFYGAARSTEEKRDYASSALWFTVLIYALFVGLMLLPGFQREIMSFAGDITNRTYRFGVVFVAFNGVFLLLQNQFRWELRPIEYAISSGLLVVSTVLLVILLTVVVDYGLDGVVIAKATSAAVAIFFCSTRLVWSFKPAISLIHLKRMIAFSLPLVPSGLAVFVGTYIDRIMLGSRLSIEAVGVYGVGFRVASIATFALVGFQASLTPLIYTHHEKPGTPRDIARVFDIFILASVAMFLLLVLFSNEIVSVIAAPSFIDAAKVIPFLVPSVLFTGMYIFAPGLAIAKKTYLILIINVVGALLNIALNVILISVVGIVGAAIATFVAHVILFMLYVVISQPEYYIPYNWGLFFTVTVYGAVSSMVFFFMSVDGALRLLFQCVLIAGYLYMVHRKGVLSLNRVKAALSANGETRLRP